MSWIYIVAVIIFAIMSSANKAGKNKKGNTRRGGMPTFGGGPDDRRPKTAGSRESGNPVTSEPRASGFPAPPVREPEAWEPSPAFPEPALSPSPDYESGEGTSYEQPEEDSVEIRQQRMKRELERVHRALDRISTDMGGEGKGPQSPGNVPVSSRAPHTAVSVKDLRSGVVWAEILGPPRARNPVGLRRHGGRNDS